MDVALQSVVLHAFLVKFQSLYECYNLEPHRVLFTCARFEVYISLDCCSFPEISFFNSYFTYLLFLDIE